MNKLQRYSVYTNCHANDGYEVLPDDTGDYVFYEDIAPAHSHPERSEGEHSERSEETLTLAEILTLAESDFYHVNDAKTMDDRCIAFARAIAAHLARKGV